MNINHLKKMENANRREGGSGKVDKALCYIFLGGRKVFVVVFLIHNW